MKRRRTKRSENLVFDLIGKCRNCVNWQKILSLIDGHRRFQWTLIFRSKLNFPIFPKFHFEQSLSFLFVSFNCQYEVFAHSQHSVFDSIWVSEKFHKLFNAQLLVDELALIRSSSPLLRLTTKIVVIQINVCVCVCEYSSRHTHTLSTNNLACNRTARLNFAPKERNFYFYFANQVDANMIRCEWTEQKSFSLFSHSLLFISFAARISHDVYASHGTLISYFWFWFDFIFVHIFDSPICVLHIAFSRNGF